MDPGLILIGATVRKLASSGKKAGFSMFAIDEYGDEDTRSAVEALITVETQDGALDENQILKAIETLDPRQERAIILGGGLDGHSGLVRHLVEHRTHIGNSEEARNKAKDPRLLFPLLDDLGIPYPEVRWDFPENEHAWLQKSGCSEGGRGVRFLSEGRIDSGDYFQRRLIGPAYSALFLANGTDIRIVGFNTLHNGMLGPRPFMFVGAANFTNLAPDILHRVADHTLKLVRELGLIGLNSIDFMLDHTMDPLILEINARPSATMSLYDDDIAQGLLNAHIRAVHGHLPSRLRTRLYRLFNIVEAPRTLLIPKGLRWPSWCKDLPCAHTVIPKSAPICSVESEASSPGRAIQLLMQRMRILEDLIGVRQQSLYLPHPI